MSCWLYHHAMQSRAYAMGILKELHHRLCILKKLATRFKIVISNPFQSSPSSAILLPFCLRITPLVFTFISKPLVLGFPTLKPWLRPSKKWLNISWCSSFKNAVSLQISSAWQIRNSSASQALNNKRLIIQNTSYYVKYYFFFVAMMFWYLPPPFLGLHS